MSAILDNALALRVLYLLITPFSHSDAFKNGLIDAEGKPLKKPKTPKEIESYSMLHRLVYRLKRVLGVLPFGKTNFASYVAAYQLVKEDLNLADYDSLEEIYISLLNHINFKQDIITEAVLLEKNALKKLFDDAPAGTTTAGVAGYDAPLSFQKVGSRSTFKQLKKKKKTVYKVNEDLFYFE